MRKFFIGFSIGIAVVALWKGNEARAQEILSATTRLDTTQASARVLLAKLKSIDDIHLSYNENSLDLDKVVILPSDPVTVQQLLDLLAARLDLEYKFHGKQIILKSRVPVNPRENFTVSGYIRDVATGESLLGATVQLKESSVGAISNLYGFYSLTLSEGVYTLVFSYVGYRSEEKVIHLNANTSINIELTEETSQLEEVLITGERPDRNVAVNQMSYNKIDAKTIEQVPALFGETDPIKVVKLLPGVSMTSETSSSYSVRGGSFDQNLILLDEAVVYNPSHLIGIFSTFNNDAIKSMEFYKGNMPSRYGGRLSSLLDIRMKEGNSKRFSGQGGISLIASRLTVEAPIVKDRSSMVLSGRRTYMDVFTKLSRSPVAKDAILHFYDLNAKVNYDINQKNKIYLSSYLGRDAFGLKSPDFSPRFDWGNFTGTFRWNHLYSQKLFSNLSFISSRYDYHFSVGSTDLELDWEAIMNDYTLKMDFDYFMTPTQSLIFGWSAALHVFNPGVMKLELRDDEHSAKSLFSRSLEYAAYLGLESQLADGKLLVSPGVRLSASQNLGSYTLFGFDENYQVTDTTYYDDGEIFNTFVYPEPRLAVTYRVNSQLSLKGGYARSIQYLHLASNSIGGTPLDVWVPSTPNVKPQVSDQYSVGVFQNLLDNRIETSLEAYYKKMKGQIDFKDHAELLLNKTMEGEFRVGKGEAYGIELMLRKPEGKVNGWISYTYSRSKRKIQGVNEGQQYLSPYDRPHNLAVVVNYKARERLDVSANWVSFSGAPITAPEGKYMYHNSVIPAYSDRNGDRMPTYHRLDVAVTLKGKRTEGKKFHSDVSLSVYNVLNRQNAAFIQFQPNEDNQQVTEAVKYTVLPIIPTLAWNFYF